jgi:hypothetical protein
MISLLEEVELVDLEMEMEKQMDALSVLIVEESAVQMEKVFVAIVAIVVSLLLTLQLVGVALTQILVSLDFSRELTTAFLTEI